VRACVRSTEIIWNRIADMIYIFNDRGYHARLASEEGNAEKRDETWTGTEKSFIKRKRNEMYAKEEKSREQGRAFVSVFCKAGVTEPLSPRCIFTTR